jgi:hypothetical protein
LIPGASLAVLLDDLFHSEAAMSSKDKRATEKNEPDRDKSTDDESKDRRGPKPTYTRTGPIVSPKFGSAGSGGAEYEPGPEVP